MEQPVRKNYATKADYNKALRDWRREAQSQGIGDAAPPKPPKRPTDVVTEPKKEPTDVVTEPEEESTADDLIKKAYDRAYKLKYNRLIKHASEEIAVKRAKEAGERAKASAKAAQERAKARAEAAGEKKETPTYTNIGRRKIGKRKE